MRELVLAFFFLSGVCGLLYEVVWIRAAGTVIGNTTYALGTVVGVYMAGLALGAAWGGRQADRRTGGRLLGLYSLLEAGVALSSLAVPFLFSASEPLFRVAWAGLGQTPVYGALRVLLVAVILLVPTTLMGATLPVLARFLTTSLDGAGREAGKAYAINTLGGVAGTLLAGFVLVPHLGLRLTTLVAVALNLLIAGVCFRAGRATAGERIDRPLPAPLPPRLPLVVAAGSGFAALVCEIAWTRALVLAVGSTVHAFTLILAAFILGLALGSAACAWALSRVRDAALALAAIQGALATAALLLLPVLGDLPLAVALKGGTSLSTQATTAALFVLLPTLLMGAVFPLAIRMASTSSVGRSVAAVYTANTTGSIAGSLAASFLLVPFLGPATAVKIAATVSLALSALLLGRRRLAALPLLGVAAAWILLPSWNPKVLASGPFLYGAADARSARRDNVDLRDYLEKDTELLAQHWDAYGLVTVHRQRNGVLSMRVNGKTDASTGPSDRANMLFVGHLPMLHHPAPKRALCIGLGAGLTLEAMAKHPVERLDCVELSRAVLRGAEHFRDASGNVLADPRVRVTVGDGRNALLFGREPYDVIVSQPSNLWVSGMANLFTRDCFREASARLAPGGVFGQWVHAYWLSPENFRDVLRTFFDVFPYGAVWEVFPGADYVLIGTRERLALDASALEERLGKTGALAEYVGLESPRVPGLLGHHVTDAPDARRAAGPGPIVTDDRCFLEYTAPGSMGRDSRADLLGWLDAVRRASTPFPWIAGLDDSLRSSSNRRREGRRALAEAVALHVHDPERAAAAIESAPKAAVDARSKVFLDLLGDQLLDRAQSRMKAVDGPGAIDLLQRVPAGSAAWFDARMLLGETYLTMRRHPEARKAFEEARAADPTSLDAAASLARALQISQSYVEAAEAWAAVIGLKPTAAAAYVQRALCVWRLGRVDEAKALCRKALEIDPKDPRAAALLKELEAS